MWSSGVGIYALVIWTFPACIERKRDVNIFDVPKYKFDVLNLLSHWLIQMMYLDSQAMLCHSTSFINKSQLSLYVFQRFDWFKILLAVCTCVKFLMSPG